MCGKKTAVVNPQPIPFSDMILQAKPSAEIIISQWFNTSIDQLPKEIYLYEENLLRWITRIVYGFRIGTMTEQEYKEKLVSYLKDYKAMFMHEFYYRALNNGIESRSKEFQKKLEERESR